MRRIAFALLLLVATAGDRTRPSSVPTSGALPACSPIRFQDKRFTVCLVDNRRDRVTLTNAGPDGQPLRSLAALRATLGSSGRSVRFAMNAGMYGEDRWPVGLYVENSVTRRLLNLSKGGGNFHFLPNGVFAVDRAGRMMVVESGRFARSGLRPLFATQSGPMLVIGGKLHPRLSDNGASELVRNGVGVQDAGHAVFAISDEPVSFGRFARLFRDRLHCPDALFLDGSVSSLWDPGAGRMDGYGRLGPMVVVYRR